MTECDRYSMTSHTRLRDMIEDLQRHLDFDKGFISNNIFYFVYCCVDQKISVYFISGSTEF